MSTGEVNDKIAALANRVLRELEDDSDLQAQLRQETDALQRLEGAVDRLIRAHRSARQERDEAQAMLREREDAYRRLQLNVPGMVYTFARKEDGHFEFPFVNQGSVELFNIPPEDLMRDASLITKLIHPEDRARFLESVSRSAETLQPWREQLRHVVDGEVRWYDCMSRPERLPNGEVLWDGIILEITERKRAEEELRRNAQLHEEAQRVAQLGHFNVDVGTGTWESSRVLDDLYGLEPGFSKTVENWLSLVHPEDRDELWRYLRAEVLEAKRPFDRQFRIRRQRDGEERWFHGRGRVEVSNDGASLRVIGTTQDVTERRRLEAQLLHSQKIQAIGQLAGGVAHDFNNMLSVILGYVELIKAGLGPNAPYLEEILEIERAARHSRDVTSQLLAFSRRQMITPKTLDLNEKIEEARGSLLRLLGGDIDLEFIPGGGLWRILFDPLQLGQILVNLAVNARDAMATGGRLTIETQNVELDESSLRGHVDCIPGEYVQLVVTDNGRGMDQETLSRAFEPFFTTKEVGKGAGLGLASVYGSLRQNGGFCNVHSEPGRGTRFEVYIPRFPGESGPAVVQRSRSSGGAATILLVEDDEMVRRMASAMLQRLGYIVLVASSPAEAVDLCGRREEPIDVLMTDVVMPGMSGRTLSEKIRELYPKTKVIFLSGHTSNVIANHGGFTPGERFLQRPFTLRSLADKVGEVLDGD